MLLLSLFLFNRIYIWYITVIFRLYLNICHTIIFDFVYNYGLWHCQDCWVDNYKRQLLLSIIVYFLIDSLLSYKNSKFIYSFISLIITSHYEIYTCEFRYHFFMYNINNLSHLSLYFVDEISERVVEVLWRVKRISSQV